MLSDPDAPYTVGISLEARYLLDPSWYCWPAEVSPLSFLVHLHRRTQGVLVDLETGEADFTDQCACMGRGSMLLRASPVALTTSCSVGPSSHFVTALSSIFTHLRHQPLMPSQDPPHILAPGQANHDNKNKVEDQPALENMTRDRKLVLAELLDMVTGRCSRTACPDSSHGQRAERYT